MEKERASARSSSYQEGEKVAKLSVLVLIAVGLMEWVAGALSGSIAVIADGAHSFADALVSLIVWLGLRISRRAPDGKFHFGYRRVETFSSIIVALLMMATGTAILYESYLTFLSPKVLSHPLLAMAAVLLAAAIAGALAFRKRKVAKKIGSLALEADAANTLKDSLSSMVAFSGVLLSSFNILQLDAVAGMVIAIFIYAVSYATAKEASLVLMDACMCPEVTEIVKQSAESLQGVEKAHGIRLRRTGSFIVGEMDIEVDGRMAVQEAHGISTKIEELIKNQIAELERLTIRVKPKASERSENPRNL